MQISNQLQLWNEILDELTIYEDINNLVTWNSFIWMLPINDWIVNITLPMDITEVISTCFIATLRLDAENVSSKFVFIQIINLKTSK